MSYKKIILKNLYGLRIVADYLLASVERCYVQSNCLRAWFWRQRITTLLTHQLRRFRT